MTDIARRATHSDRLDIDVYSFYQGRGSLNAVMALKNLFDLTVDAGVSGGPMTLHGLCNLSDADLETLMEMVREGYASPVGYAQKDT